MFSQEGRGLSGVSRLVSGVLASISLSLAGCSLLPAGHDAGRDIASVGMWILPPDGGMAFCSFEKNGATHCGHLSGDAVPFVHENRGQTAPEAIKAIWRAGAAAVASGELIAGRQGHKTGQTKVYVVLGNGRELSVAWPYQGRAPGSQSDRLADLVQEHCIPGSW